jgi:ATP-dependent helicase/nuclease subunit B
MRTQLGLPAPEWRIGLSAHDFVQAAAAPRAVLTRARKVDGAPTVPSRWLLRLENLLRGMNAEAALEPERPYLAWFAALDDPGTAPQPAPPPRPTPPLPARPRALSVTEIETLIRDPYAIYARHVLGLRPLDPIDAEPGPLERGTIIHRALEGFVRSCPDHLPADAEARLIALGRGHFAALGLPPSLLAFWLPRFARLASWFAAFERAQRAERRPLALEVSGRITLPAPFGPFTLKAKADRIDRTQDGRLVILDYKTGKAPTRGQIETGFAPQLPLEALIAAAGGFEAVPAAEVARLAYVELTGGDPPGKPTFFEDVATLAALTQMGVRRLIAAFDDPSIPYLSRPRPQFQRWPGQYDHLARVLEWAGAGEEP